MLGKTVAVMIHCGKLETCRAKRVVDQIQTPSLRLVCCAFQVLEADSMSVFHIQFLLHFDTSQDVNTCAQAVGRCPMQRRITVETKIFKIITQTQPKVLEPLEARGKITQLTQLNATNSN